MMLKILGVICIISGCGSVGFKIAANYRREEKSLRQLVDILDYMASEINYRLTPIPELCRYISKQYNNLPGKVFWNFSMYLEKQTLQSTEQCMMKSVNQTRQLPPITKDMLMNLGKTIGQFDLDGQLKGIESVRRECVRNLDSLGSNRENRLRSYQTLGLCAGAALAILFV